MTDKGIINQNGGFDMLVLIVNFKGEWKYYLDGVNRKREVGPGSATSSFFFSTPLAMTKGDGEARQLPASCLDPAAVAAALSQSSGA